MISSIIDAVLLTALAATSVCVLLMYRRLQRFDALQNEAAKAFVRCSQALENARAALEALHDHSGDMAVSLASRLNEARLVLNEIEQGIDKRTARARQDDAEFAAAARRSARAEAHPPASAADLDFLREWTDRFGGLGNRARAGRTDAVYDPSPTGHGGSAAMSAEDVSLLPVSQPNSPTWRELANAAQRLA